MTSSETAFIGDIKAIAERETSDADRRKAAEARFRRLEEELEQRYAGDPDGPRHVARELADLRRAMLIELEKDPPATVGSLLDVLVARTRRG